MRPSQQAIPLDVALSMVGCAAAMLVLAYFALMPIAGFNW